MRVATGMAVRIEYSFLRVAMEAEAYKYLKSMRTQIGQSIVAYVRRIVIIADWHGILESPKA